MFNSDTDIKNLFEAKASNLYRTMTSYASKVGFRIPEYQRTYDWKKDNLDRLIVDCLRGFYQLSKSDRGQRPKYTFLGTIILVKEEAESNFEGTSLAIVDGQQRLTSLLLICCVLYETINRQWVDLKDNIDFQDDFLDWIEDEKTYILNHLEEIVLGSLPPASDPTFYPRLVRTEDNRGIRKYQHYESNVGKFLSTFDQFCHGCTDAEFHPYSLDESDPLFKNFKYLRKLFRELIKKTEDKLKDEIQSVDKKSFEKRPFRSLLGKLPREKSTSDRFVSFIAKNDELEGFFWALFFSVYILNYVVLTRVETSDEDAAFDIFDALNTTGEPLTALETLKPLIVQFESNESPSYSYKGSDSEISFDRIEKHLKSKFEETNKRQREIQQLLVSFALYFKGHKLGLKTNEQRIFLRTNYKKLYSPDLKRNFVNSIADVAEFRFKCWDPDNSTTLQIYQESKKDSLRLCLALLRDMKTKLVIPIITRYWVDFNEIRDEDKFVAAVKALTAFIVLRRAFTGGTALIDGDLRSVMSGESKLTGPKKLLSVGTNFRNKIWTVEELKERLMGLLCIKVMGDEKTTLQRENWVNGAKVIPIAERSQPLSRFLLLVAAHQSKPKSEPGLMTREGVVKSDHLEYLNIANWKGEKYKTLEHIVPKKLDSSWDIRFKDDLAKLHTIGNLTLLPTSENSSAGNASWAIKRHFYRTLAAKTENERDKLIQDATVANIVIGTKTKTLLKNEQIEILDSIKDVNNWKPELVEKRSKNLLELVYDVMIEWIEPKETV